MAEQLSATTLKSLRPAGDKGMFAVKQRVGYAWNDSEQVFQRRHTTEREIGSSILMPAVQAVERMLLYQDLFSQARYRLRGQPEKANLLAAQGKEAKSITAGLYRGFNDVAFKTYGAEFLRASSVAYNEIEDYQLVYNVIDDMHALAKTAEAVDPSAQSLAKNLRQALVSDVHVLFSDSAHANRVLTDYGRGCLALTSHNLDTLESAMKGLVALERKSRRGAAPAATPSAASAYDFPSLFDKPAIHSAAEAQILLGILPILLMDGAIPLNTEIYVPLDRNGIGAEGAVKLAKAIQGLFSKSSLAVNVTADGSALLPDVPVGAVIKSENGNFRPLISDEVLSLANELHRILTRDLGLKPEQLKNFTRDNYRKIQQAIARDDGVSPHLSLSVPASKTVPAFNLPEWEKQGDGRMLHPWPMAETGPRHISVSQRVGAAWRNATREEALHETDKLYWRQFHTFLWNFPVVAIKNYLLFNFGKLMEGAGLREARPRKTHSIQETLAHSHMMPFWKRNLLSNAWVLAATPMVKAHFVVVGREIIKSNNQIAGETLSAFEPQLQEILKQGISESAGLKEGLEALWHPQSANAPLEARLQELQQKRARWEQLLNPGYAEEFSRRPARTTGEALMAIAYIQVLMQESHKALRSLEFIDPDGVVVEANQIMEITDFARAQAKLAGFSGNGPVTEAGLIRYANALTEKLCLTIPPEKLQLAISGKHHQLYHDRAEHLIQSVIQPPDNIVPSVESPPAVDMALTRPWSTRSALPSESAFSAAWKQATRAEAEHESKLLFRRTLFKRIAFLIPSYTENLLLGHKNTIENVAGTLWEFVSYPFAYGPGIVFTKEFAKFRERQAIVQSESAQGLLGAAGMAAWHDTHDALSEEARRTAGNPFLEAAAASDAYRDVSILLSKQEQDTAERSVLQHFKQDYGDAILNQARLQLNGKKEPDLGARLRRIAAGPVGGVAEARLALSAVRSLLRTATEQVDMLLFIPKSKQLLDRRQVQALSSYVQAQIEDAGFVLQAPAKDTPAILMKRAGGGLVPLEDNDIIRLANVAAGKLRELVGAQKLSHVLAEGSADLQEHISQFLYAGAGKMRSRDLAANREDEVDSLASSRRVAAHTLKRLDKNGWQSLSSLSGETRMPVR